MPTLTPPSQPTWIVQPYGFIAQGANTAFSWSTSTAGTVNDTITYSINYSINGGATWTNVATGITGTSYTWTIPSNIITGTVLYLQVVSLESNGQTSTSPNSGAITVVSLQQPSPVATSVVPSTIMTYTNDPLIMWRKGTADDPFVQKNDNFPVINGRIVLSEVPNPLTRVTITGYFEVNDPALVLLSNEFFVDYSTGLVLFNSSENNKTVTTSYKGRGKIMFPANRVYLNSDNQSYYNNFPQTVQDIVDTHSTAVQVESNIVYYIKYIQSIGNVTALTTTDKTSLVSAINEVKDQANTNTANIGVVADLTTTANTNLVVAVNEVKSEADTNKLNIGIMASLSTTVKDDLVGAINEVKTQANTSTTNIGTMANLATIETLDLVSAINEVKNQANTSTTSIGTLANLTTTVKNDIVSSINELKSVTNTINSNIGTLSSLSTSIKTDLVSAVNEVKSQADTNTTNIGTMSNLSTTVKSNVVSAVNEVRTELRKITDGNGTIVGATITVGNVASLPTASASNRNQLAVVQGDGVATADIVYVCMISATGTYSWKQIISG